MSLPEVLVPLLQLVLVHKVQALQL
uniref:Uncharacterized protein n=1 Tax=Arundo donax TaxID=35708 RepID=A0A0A9F4C8_ARUDO